MTFTVTAEYARAYLAFGYVTVYHVECYGSFDVGCNPCKSNHCTVTYRVYNFGGYACVRVLSAKYRTYTDANISAITADCSLGWKDVEQLSEPLDVDVDMLSYVRALSERRTRLIADATTTSAPSCSFEKTSGYVHVSSYICEACVAYGVVLKHKDGEGVSYCSYVHIARG